MAIFTGDRPELFAYMNHLFFQCLRRDASGLFYMLNEKQQDLYPKFEKTHRKVSSKYKTRWFLITPLIAVFLYRKGIDWERRRCFQMVWLDDSEVDMFESWQAELCPDTDCYW